MGSTDESPEGKNVMTDQKPTLVPETTIDLDAIKRRIPAVTRKQMSLHERDRVDLVAEVERLRSTGHEKKVVDATVTKESRSAE